MNCHKDKCHGELQQDEVDSRQEWCDVYYSCKSCGAEYTLSTIFKAQSKLVESQFLYDSNGNAVE